MGGSKNWMMLTPFGVGFHQPFKGGYIGLPGCTYRTYQCEKPGTEASYRYTHQDESVHAYMYVLTKLTSLVRSPDYSE